MTERCQFPESRTLSALLAPAPRFSLYLEALAIERENAAAAIAPHPITRWPDADAYEPARHLPEPRDKKGPTEHATVEHHRVTQTSPAGRFLDLLI